MFISKGFKALGSALVPILIFSQTAMAAPSIITYQNAAGQNIQANYLNALLQAPMKTSLSNALMSNELANLPIFVTDDSGSVINYSAAISKNEVYAEALTDSAVNHATAPVATEQMNTDGTVTAVVTLAGISSVNGTVTVTLSSAPTVTPISTDFTVMNGTTVVVPINVSTTGTVVTLTVPVIAATALAQSIVYSAAYKGGTTKSASAFTISPAGPIASVSAVNGTVTVTLSSVPTVTPAPTDIVVKQSINGATATTVTLSLKMNGAVATFSDDVVPATTASQSVVYSVSYKGGAYISAPAFVVSAGVNANVGSASDLATALANPSITSITFTASLSASPNITRPLTMNLGAYILTGDVSFSYTGAGTSVLTGIAGTRITGNLTVNTGNASFKNGVRVGGTVNVENVQEGTWTESADGNTLTITDPDGAVITVTGDPSSVTVAEGSGGSLTLNVNAGGTVINITSNAPVNIVVATGAMVQNITSAAGSAGTDITNNGTTGTVTADVQTNIVVGTSGTVTNITIAAGASGSTITNNGIAGTVTANAPTAITVAAGANVTNITTAAGASGSTITNNGTAGTVTANVPTAITVATGAKVTHITAAAGSDGSTITNNGTTGTVTADVPINLVANVPPTNTVTSGSGTVAVTGTGAGTVVVTEGNGLPDL